MARNIIQNAFNAGEITPELYGRDDTASYRQGCRTLENFIVKPLGGVTRRPGTMYDFAVKSTTKPTRIFPFSFKDERHMVEVGEDYLRIHEQDVSTGLWTVQQDEGFELPRIISGATDLAHWQSPFVLNGYIVLDTSMNRMPLRSFMGPVQLTTTATTLPGGLSLATNYWVVVGPGVVSATGTTGAIEPVDLESPVNLGFCTTLAKAQEFDAVFESVPFPDVTAVTSFGTGTGQHTIRLATSNNEYEFVTPWQDADMPNLRAEQVDDVMYFYDGNNPIYELRRVDYVGGNTRNEPAPDTKWTKPKWTIEESQLNSGPWTKRISWSYDVPTSDLIVRSGGYYNFDETAHDVGQMEFIEDYIPLVDSTTAGEFDSAFAQRRAAPEEIILGRVSSTPSDTDMSTQLYPIIGTFTTGVGVATECNNVAGGFAFRVSGPSAMAWYDERLILSGGFLPNEVHLSSIRHPLDFLPVNRDTGAISTDTSFSFDIAGDADNAIVAYSELQDLLIFSGDGVWIANSESGVEGINATSIAVRQIATVGCSSIVDPVRMQQAVAYMSKTNKRLQFVQYNFDAKDYRSFDILEHGEHLLQPVATGIAFQDEPFDILWIPRADGNFVSVTLKKEEGVVGGAVQTLGGTAATAEDIITIPAEDNDSDVVYMVVRRTVNSTDAQFVEHITPQISLGTKYTGTKSDAYHVDCGQTFTGSIASFTMAHLLNETVDVMADGEYLGEIVLDGSGASGTLPAAPSGATQPYAKVHAGYTYTSELEPMPPVYTTQGGTTAGSISDIKSVTLRMLGSIGGSCGDRADVITDSDGHSVLGAIPYPDDLDNLFTGDVSVNPEIMTSAQPTVVFRQTKPFPSTVNAIIYRADGTLAADSEGRQIND